MFQLDMKKMGFAPCLYVFMCIVILTFQPLQRSPVSDLNSFQQCLLLFFLYPLKKVTHVKWLATGSDSSALVTEALCFQLLKFSTVQTAAHCWVATL